MAKKIYITIFLIICLIPAVFMLILGPSTAGGNEVLSPKPHMGTEVLSETSDFIGDHFAFRKEFISAWSWLNSKLFATSSDSQVIQGKGGSLYYCKDLDDFEGRSLSSEDLQKIASNLKELQSEIESRGGQFIFTIAPNKSSIHGEDMPSRFHENHALSNAVLIEPYLKEQGINYINLFDPSIPYYRMDSHWTEEGAAMAADALLGTDYSSGSFYEDGSLHKGDLYDMLYPSSEGVEKAVVYGGDLPYETESNINGGNAMNFETTGAGDKTLFCWRDSFGITLYPYLASATKSAVFSRSTDFNAEKTENADIVILEIVERNLDYLL